MKLPKLFKFNKRFLKKDLKILTIFKDFNKKFKTDVVLAREMGSHKCLFSSVNFLHVLKELSSL